jgi:hypothetical protein
MNKSISTSRISKVIDYDSLLLSFIDKIRGRKPSQKDGFNEYSPFYKAAAIIQTYFRKNPC